ncbi:MAG: hypothetical protein QXQ57_03270 [Sulfolobales archaeon]
MVEDVKEYLNASRESQELERYMVNAINPDKRYRVGHIVVKKRPRVGYIRQKQ